MAARVGFPAACKLVSSRLVHKAEAGGVILGVANPAGLARALAQLKRKARERRLPFDGMLVQEMVGEGVELVLGGTADPTFGPTVLFGAGGKYVELIQDYSISMAPVSPSEARELVFSTRLSAALGGYRSGPKVDVRRLCRIISRFSRIMVENPSIREMEINPLTATGKRILAVDTRILLGPRKDNRVAVPTP